MQIRLASLFFGTAPRTRKRKRKHRSKYYVTLKPYWEANAWWYAITMSWLIAVFVPGSISNSLLLPLLSLGYILSDVLRRWSARIADGTGSSLVSASSQSFIDFPLCHDWLCQYYASHYPLPVFGSYRCCSYHSFRSAHASAVRFGLSCLNIGSMVGVPSRSSSGLHSADTACSSLFSSYTGIVLMRCVNSTFSFPF